MKRFILKHAPLGVQDLAIGLFNSRQYRRRHGGRYHYWRQYFASWEEASREALEAEQGRRLGEFLVYVTTHSAWYQQWRGRKLEEFPLLEKSDILQSLDRIATHLREGRPRFVHWGNHWRINARAL